LGRLGLRTGIDYFELTDGRMIWFNGFPFLDKKEDHSFGVPVSAVMIRDLVLLPSVGIKLDEVQSILSDTDFGGFPIVQDRDSKILLGYIGRTELKYAIGISSPSPTDDRSSETFPSRIANCDVLLFYTG
jgi:hypothetical protein